MEILVKISIVDNIKPIYCYAFDFTKDLKWIRAYKKKSISFFPIDKIVGVTVGKKKKKKRRK